MKFSDLFDETLTTQADILNLDVTAVTEDSRHVQPGAVFFAFNGEHVDGHDYIDDAKKAGAIAVIGDRPGHVAPLPYFSPSSPRKVLGIAAHRLQGDPSQSMTVIGVTGTNGKSSTVAFIRAILDHAGHRTAAFGTLGFDIAGTITAASKTTPFAEELATLFAQARDENVTHIVMEVSSHAIDQNRIAGIAYDAAVFTNLTQDHLDYHHDMERYFAVKRRIVRRITNPKGFMVINVDDAYGKRLAQEIELPCIGFGSAGECQASKISLSLDATRFKVATPWGKGAVEMRLLGKHNVSNALAAIALCGGLGVSLDECITGVENLQAVPGRFEQIDCGQDFAVIVDYAHTEDGLRNVLQAARAVTKGRVIVIFGCGGDRDRSKRPKMAAAAAELADFAIVTSDNPRTEDPNCIVLDVEAGMQHAGKKKDDDYEVEIDRATAIARGIELTHPGDLLLIAGKGHEDYQILGAGRIHFDDREVARDLLNNPMNSHTPQR